MKYAIFIVTIFLFFGCGQEKSTKTSPPLLETEPTIQTHATRNDSKLAIDRDLLYLTLGLKLFQLHTGEYPTTEQGLKALMECPEKLSGWDGPYIENVPKDPWDNLYSYTKLSEQNPQVDKDIPFDLRSLGEDGILSDDDIVADNISEILDIKVN